MSLSSDIRDAGRCLETFAYGIQREHLQNYGRHVGSLETCAEQAKELETLVKQAFELLSGEWEPDDVDRHRFLKRLERAIP